jgi:hypothetical protein
MRSTGRAMDLKNASRGDLSQLVLAQREGSAQLDQRLARQQTEGATLPAAVRQLLEHRGTLTAPPPGDPPPAGAGGTRHPTGVPGTKPTAGPPRPKQPRKRRSHGFARQRMEPTAPPAAARWPAARSTAPAQCVRCRACSAPPRSMAPWSAAGAAAASAGCPRLTWWGGGRAAAPGGGPGEPDRHLA